MKKSLLISLSVVGVVVLTCGILTGAEYNSLVKANESVAGEEADVVTALNARNNIIANMVTTVDAYMDHESSIYEAITDARTQYSAAVDSGDYASIIAADEATSVALSNFLAVVEDNPQMQSALLAEDLMVAIESSEYLVKVARDDYNDVVQSYNTNVKLFPKVMFANMFGFDSAKPYWQTSSGEEIAVNFGA